MAHRRTILITGASSGIGAALALAFADPQRRLVLLGRDEERLETIAKKVRTRGAEAMVHALDLVDVEGMAALIGEIDEANPVDCAIFNAGVGGLGHGAMESPEAVAKMIDVNFRAPLVAASVLGARMAERGGGALAFVSSFAAYVPLPMAPTYAASKAGLNAFARALRGALERRGVTVTLICPAFVDTPMSRSLRCWQPFLVSADAAAARMKTAIENGKRELVFPRFYWGMRWLVALIPARLTAALLRRIPAQPSPAPDRVTDRRL